MSHDRANKVIVECHISGNEISEKDWLEWSGENTDIVGSRSREEFEDYIVKLCWGEMQEGEKLRQVIIYLDDGEAHYTHTILKDNCSIGGHITIPGF